FVAQDIECELTIERGAIEQMRDQIIAIRFGVCRRLLFEARVHAVVYIPIRGVYGDVADGVTLFLEHGPEAIALFGRVAFLQEGIAEEACEATIGLDQRLIAFEISGEIFVSSFRRIEIGMRVG